MNLNQNVNSLTSRLVCGQVQRPETTQDPPLWTLVTCASQRRCAVPTSGLGVALSLSQILQNRKQAKFVAQQGAVLKPEPEPFLDTHVGSRVAWSLNL
jgi:hypothetical protein